MNRVLQTAIVAIALAAMAAAQGTTPPATPAPPAAPAPAEPRLKTRAAPRAPAVPAAPAAPAKGYSYLGVDVRDVTPERIAALKLKDDRGVEITLVDRDAPAGKAGLKEQDVILSFNGRNIQGGEELRKLIRETPPGQTVELGISRDGQPMTIKAQLADKHKVIVLKDRKFVMPKVRIPPVELPMITTYSRRNGVVVENLTPQLGEVFGVKNGEGVLIRSVEKGSAGDSAGLRAGDVIVRVGNQRVEGTSDWNRLMREQKPGPVQIGIVRDKRQQSLSLTIPERSAERSSAMAFSMEDFDHDMENLKGLDLEEYGHSLDQLNRLQPEIDRAMRETQERIQRELERSQRDWQRDAERAQRDAERAQREAERAQRHAQRAKEQAQREAERAQRELEREQQKQKQEKEQEKSTQPEKPPPPPE